MPCTATDSSESAVAFLAELLNAAACVGASDLHLAADAPPTLRVHGKLMPLSDAIVLAADIERFCDELLSVDQRGALARRGALDLSLEIHGARLRAHVFRSRGSLAAALRIVPSGLPDSLAPGPEEWMDAVAALRRGLVLVTGPTGSGKSTTLATLLDRINRERAVHIVTIEDPIEYVHQPRRAWITQREVPGDTPGFAEALRGVLREDPDVVLIGEIRDRETLEAALTVAETGHLVFSSLHTGSAVQAVHRIIDMFAPPDQAPIRAQLSAVLEVVVAQQLLPRADGSGRVAAIEVLQATAAIRNLIREGKLHQLESSMQLGRSQSGARSMAQAIGELFARGHISREEALASGADAQALAVLALKAPKTANSLRAVPLRAKEP